MKKHPKRYKVVLFVTIPIILLFGVPALINLLFKLHAFTAFFAAEWDAGDVLGFYGTLLASFIAIIGVFLSINFAQKNYREDEKNRQRPYLALTHIQQDMKFDLLGAALESINNADVVNNGSYYREFKLDNIYIIISSNGIEYKYKLNSKQENLLRQRGCIWEGDNTTKVLSIHNYISIPFELENVGNGAAIDLKIAFNKKDCLNRRAVSLYTLKCNDKVYFHIFSELESEDILGEYTLELLYRDILGNEYTQKYPVSFTRENNAVKETIDLTGTQEIVMED